MFAIFEDGSHQYRVSAGDRLEVDFREAAQVGDSLQFDRILAAGTDATGQIGQPLIDGATIQAEVVDKCVKAPKLEIGKFRRRKGYIRHNGHTQKYTQVRITAINVPNFGSSEEPAHPAPAHPAPASPVLASPQSASPEPASSDVGVGTARPEV